MFQVTEATYGDYSYPRWAIAYGWCVGIVSLVPIPVVAVMEVRKQKGSFLEVSTDFEFSNIISWYNMT